MGVTVLVLATPVTVSTVTMGVGFHVDFELVFDVDDVVAGVDDVVDESEDIGTETDLGVVDTDVCLETEDVRETTEVLPEGVSMTVPCTVGLRSWEVDG